MENQKSCYEVVIKCINENNDVIKEKTLTFVDNNDPEEYLGRYLPTMEKLINQINNGIDEVFGLKGIRFNIIKDSDKKAIIIHGKLPANDPSYMELNEVVDVLTIFVGEIARKAIIFHDIDDNVLIIRLMNTATDHTLTLYDEKGEDASRVIKILGESDDRVTLNKTYSTDSKRRTTMLNNGWGICTTLRKNVLYEYERLIVN